MNADQCAGLQVNEQIIIDGQHVASMWPRPETNFAGIPAYSNGAAWEEDEKWKTIYQEQFATRHKNLPVPDRDVWWWRDNDKVEQYIAEQMDERKSQ